MGTLSCAVISLIMAAAVGDGVVTHLVDGSIDCCPEDNSILPSHPGATADSLTPPANPQQRLESLFP